MDTAAETATDNTELMIAVLAFGALALLIVGAVQARRGRAMTSNFVKLYGLLFIATLATAVVFPDLSDDARTGVYTVFGTIAGYLAGARPVATPTESGAAASSDPSQPSEQSI